MAAMSLVIETSFPRSDCRPANCRLRRVLPGAGGQADNHERALVNAGHCARLEVVHGMHAWQLLGAQDRIPQSRAKFGGPGLCGLERALGGGSEDQPSVERVGGEAVGGRNIVGLLVDSAEI